MNNDPRYADINNVNYPSCSRAEAKRAFESILKRLGKKTAEYPAQIHDARGWRGVGIPRRCWISTKPTTEMRKGWGRLIHDVSHMIFRARRPNSRPHDHGHEAVEREVLIFCQQSGWLDGKLKPTVVKLTTDEKRAKRLREINAGLKRWETKAKRADTAIRKLKAESRRIYRAIAKDLREPPA